MSAIVYSSPARYWLSYSRLFSTPNSRFTSSVKRVDRVGLVALGVAQPAEVAALAALRPLVGHLPDQPLDDLVFRPQRLREELSLLLGDIQHDRAGFEDGDRLAAAGRVVIHQHRHAVIGVHLEEFRRELVAAPDIARARSCTARRAPPAGLSPSCRSASASSEHRTWFCLSVLAWVPGQNGWRDHHATGGGIGKSPSFGPRPQEMLVLRDKP